ncbi:MAG: hypothetical protein ABI910_22485, partial [Gemmatimonadota bacterium]
MHVSNAARIGAISLLTSLLAACAAASVEAPDAARTPHAGEVIARNVTSAICTRQWNAAMNGDWDDAAQWNPVGVPAAADTVCIQTPGSYVVTVRTAVPTIAGKLVLLRHGQSVWNVAN